MKKYKFLLITTCLFMIYRTVEAQNSKRITISFEKESLATILLELEKQTCMGFILTTKCINQAPLITIKTKNAPLTDVLNMICKGTPFTYCITENIIMLAPRPVRGQVFDEMGMPVADVLVEAGDHTALTNSKGEFYLRYASCDKMIKFSHPGDTLILRNPGKTYVSVRMRNRNTITAN